MRFTATAVAGVYVVEIEPRPDERGFFARTWCVEEFARAGLETRLDQCGVAYNVQRGTLRGLHYQLPPWAEVKLVRCTRGAVFDVALDLRPGSATFRRWVGTELSAENRRALYIPCGCAHGLLTLDADSEVFYQISAPYRPGSARGVRWDDPLFGIEWPAPVRVIAPRDRDYPDADPTQFELLRGLETP